MKKFAGFFKRQCQALNKKMKNKATLPCLRENRLPLKNLCAFEKNIFSSITIENVSEGIKESRKVQKMY